MNVGAEKAFLNPLGFFYCIVTVIVAVGAYFAFELNQRWVLRFILVKA